MATDQVPAESVTHAQRRLQVDGVADLQVFQRRNVQCLNRDIGVETIVVQVHGCQAYAVHRYAVAYRVIGPRQPCRRDAEAHVAAALVDRADRALRLDDSGKH